MECLLLLQYLTLRMSKWYKVTLHDFVSVSSDMFEHMDGVRLAFAKKTTSQKGRHIHRDAVLVVLAQSPGLDHTNESLWFQTHPKTRPADSWQSKPRHVPVNPRVSLGMIWPVGSNLWFSVSGFALMVACRYGTVNRKYWHWYSTVHFRRISSLVLQTKHTLVPNPIPKMSVNRASTEHEQSINDNWSCIFGIMSGAWSQASRKKDMAACIGRYVRDILATFSRTETTHFIYRAATNYSWGL